LLGVFLHFPGHLLGPFIVWLAKRDDSPEIDAHGKESLNFQISMLIYNAVAAVFCLVLIGFVFLAILWVLNGATGASDMAGGWEHDLGGVFSGRAQRELPRYNAVFVIIASIQASDGKFYRYPMTIRFIQ
jgi:uncharacterized Tic20 family protein